MDKTGLQFPYIADAGNPLSRTYQAFDGACLPQDNGNCYPASIGLDCPVRDDSRQHMSRIWDMLGEKRTQVVLALGDNKGIQRIVVTREDIRIKLRSDLWNVLHDTVVEVLECVYALTFMP
ncbi:MAG: hypothetical protein COY83_03325 [Parcubacteria group bacterium CG_4_10_14_0_8_um_filter_48_154]|nr:MAG: hypothetical protein COY83_03325 [Parcubacteria group bacterium CG_4_10_14_0_8_um_filter_48_154]